MRGHDQTFDMRERARAERVQEFRKVGILPPAGYQRSVTNRRRTAINYF
jgi:hypothetical protein